MEKIVDIQTGAVRAQRGKGILKSSAIGSCIAIAAYDAVASIGAMAHVMLPGSAPADKKNSEKTKYTANAIDTMIGMMTNLGTEKNNIEVVIAGGANVLKRKDDTICKSNIKSTLKILKEKQLHIKAQAIGGTSRRSISLDVENGIVSYTEGNGGEMKLWSSQK
ncbi:MAG: chemotaxis protein CheD, partial [Desulfobulbaceae bacterium]|nr:chemotaxis protein CheD [Desulfobulbaceae bacterium]